MTAAQTRPAPMRAAIAGMQDSLIRRVSDAGRDTPGLIALWFGESDVPTPAFVTEAAKAALDAGETLYAPNQGIPELCAALARYEGRLHGAPIGPERITVTASGMNALMLAMQLIVDPGDGVSIVTPVWPNCIEVAHVMGGVVHGVPLSPGNAGWALDLDRLFDSCDARTRAIFINSPGNPTGWVIGRDEQRAVLAFARERGIWVVADEVYLRIAYGAPWAPSFLDIAAPDDPLIVVNSFSKSWCMTGWRLGWLTHPPDLGERFAMLNEFNIAGPPPFVQTAGVAAIEQGESFIGEIKALYEGNRDIVCARLATWPRARMSAPAGAFYAFFRLDGMDDSMATALDVIRRARVGLAPGAAFGPAGEGWMRLCFAVKTETLITALDRLEPILGRA